MPSLPVTPLVVAYVVIGAFCLAWVSSYAGGRKASSTFGECLCSAHPLLIALVFLLWPILALNDIYISIPQQRRDRLQRLRSERPGIQQRRAQEQDRRREYNAIIGQTGIASTDLRLAGDVLIDDESWMAASEHGFIAAGTPIVVASRQGNLLRVKRKTN